MLRFTSPMEEVIKFELSKQLGVIEGLTSTVQIRNKLTTDILHALMPCQQKWPSLMHQC